MSHASYESKVAELEARLVAAQRKLADNSGASSQLSEDELHKQIEKLQYQRIHLKRSIDNINNCTAVSLPTSAPRAALAKPEFKIDPAHMSNIKGHLAELFAYAVQQAYPTFLDEVPINATANRKFGDYQCNIALQLPKKLTGQEGAPKNPREAAEKIIKALPESPVVGKVDVAGSGFINITLKDSIVEELVRQVLTHGVTPPAAKKLRVCVDFSSPNIAKEMHVGHLRSTIIGDCISRLLEFVGHDVVRINHVGDWGTQFGMLIAHLEDKFPNYATVSPPIGDLQAFYKESKARFDSDEEFKKRAYDRVVKLQQGDANIRHAWTLICDVSRLEFQRIYDRLKVRVYEKGESFYQPLMGAIVEDLEKKNLIVVQDGRKLMWKTDANEGVPLTVEKSDGGYTYDTSDLAALRYRLDVEKADWLIYVVDAGQSLHFDLVFGAAQRAGYYNTATKRVDHVAFGLVLGEDSKKFKTRSGDTVRLVDLLDEALVRATAAQNDVGSKDLTEAESLAAKEAVAYSSIKYADLSSVRTSDYKFSFDRMLSLKGNTAVYLIYALVRIRSIQRTAGAEAKDHMDAKLALSHPKEQEVAKLILQFPEVIEQVLRDLMPHTLCEYLYTLCTATTDFLETCRVVQDAKKETQTVDYGRLLLCDAAVRVMHTAFSILGLTVVEKM